MTELRTKTSKKTKKHDLSSESFSNFFSTPANPSRLSLPCSKSVKKTCPSLEIENSSYEEYTLEYSTYLLRKAQNKLLSQNRSSYEENVKECLVSHKLKFEELLEKNLKLRKDWIFCKSCFDIIKGTTKKIQNGRMLLECMRENKYMDLLKNLSNSLNNVTDQLELVDIDKRLIEEMFEKNVWGSGCEIEECLKKIYNCISKNKDRVSSIAEELKELKQVCLENSILKEKFGSLLKNTAGEFLEANYSFSVNAVKNALIKRKDKIEGSELDFDIPELDGFNKEHQINYIFEPSRLESFVTPKNSSTPHGK